MLMSLLSIDFVQLLHADWALLLQLLLHLEEEDSRRPRSAESRAAGPHPDRDCVQLPRLRLDDGQLRADGQRGAGDTAGWWQHCKIGLIKY